MLYNKLAKNLVLTLIFVCISAICAFFMYNFYQSSRDEKIKILYSMDRERYLYLTNNLSQVQNTMLKDSTIGIGYYRTYSKYEFAYFAKILDWIQSYQIAQAKPIKVLDVGCAYGTLLFYIRQNLPLAELYGIDFVDNYFSKKIGTEKAINFVVSNIESEPLPFNDKFDVIILTEVLEHFNYNPIETLKKLAAALKDDGVLYLSTPDSSSGWGVTKKYYQSFNEIPTIANCTLDKKCTNIDDHVWQYNLKELLSVIHLAGFEVEKLEYTFSAPQSRHFNLLLRKQSS